MAKILEGPAMKLFNKWGIPVPNYVVIMDPDRLAQLGEANKKCSTNYSGITL